MFGAYSLEANQQNLVVFVLVDDTNTEVSGLGTGFTLELSKAGGAFAASAGTKAEIGDGWYSYLTTSGEADTYGPLSIKVTHASIVQQNIPCVIGSLAINAISFTYTVTEPDFVTPIEGVECWFCTDSMGNNIAKYCITDSFGIARLPNSSLLPRLDPGTYYVFRQRVGYSFSDPDTEDVS